MPMYLWFCEKCKQESEVIRSIADYQTPPNIDDGITACVSTEDTNQPTPQEASSNLSPQNHGHTWERRIPSGSGQFHLVGYGWARDGYN